MPLEIKYSSTGDAGGGLTEGLVAHTTCIESQAGALKGRQSLRKGTYRLCQDHNEWAAEINFQEWPKLDLAIIARPVTVIILLLSAKLSLLS